MIGQGSPNTSPARFASISRQTLWGCRLLVSVCLAILLRGPLLAEETMRLRISWGGGVEALWQGTAVVSEGTISSPQPLGIEADEPGSIWIEHGPPFTTGPDEESSTGMPPESEHLVIRQRSPRTYDGVDLTVTAPPDADLLVELSAPGNENSISVPLARLKNDVFSTNLDDAGNRLLVSRAPGDALRVTLKHRSLVFGPGDLLQFDLQPHLLPGEADAKLRVKVQLLEGRTTHELWSQELSAVAGDRVPVEVPLPDREGVYDVVLTATHPPWLQLPQPVRLPDSVRLPESVRLSQSIRGKQPLAKRKVQVLVLDSSQPLTPVGVGRELTRVAEIDPANPKWWERFTKLPQPRRLSRFWKDPLGNGNVTTREHPLGEMVQLNPLSKPDDVAWEAYVLPVDHLGWPHVLEVEYPSDVPQTLGISIIEPNLAGAVLPIGLDSGVDLAEEVVGRLRKTEMLTHRVIFWPRTKSPLVLITNRRDGSSAVYSKIRVRAFGEHLPRAFPAQGPVPERLFAGYLDRPLFPENFSASEDRVASSDLGVDDWLTFYQGGRRLVEYLNHVGYGGLMISVFADGSTIYPSQVLQPTPRYDTGVFLEDGQDPVRKDVLEMLFRQFDRDGLQLVPAMEFASPLPELEAQLRKRGQEGSHGIRWIGPEGKTWLQTRRLRRSLAPYYNLLDWQVQQAMLAAIRELVRCYGHHASFAGLAIQLSADGYAQLPGPEWGMDDVTIARFEQDTGVQVPGEGPHRFADRARFLAPGEPGDSVYPSTWLKWRADQVQQFYRRVQAELAAVCPGRRLYLAGANMLAGEQMQQRLRPSLPRKMTIAEAMLQVGIDAKSFGRDSSLVLLRPETVTPRWSLAGQAVNLELAQMLEVRQRPDMTRPFEDHSVPGSLFFHRSQEIRVSSFDQKSPFKPCHAWLATQPVPSGWQNRRRFVHSLATLDSQVVFDGGWQLPMGQEDSIRDLLAAYRQLPAVRFRPVSDPSGLNSSQPVTIRYATVDYGTYAYLVNEAPFATTVTVEVSCRAGCRVEELTGWREVPALKQGDGSSLWTLSLEPYDLVAVRFSAPDVVLMRPQVRWSDELQAELENQIASLGDRITTLKRSPPTMAVLQNPSFELPPAADGQITGWATTSQPGTTIDLDPAGHRGTQSIKITSRGPAASLISQGFDPPTTGRLTMAVHFRTTSVQDQPPLRLVLEGDLHGRPFPPRFAPVGSAPGYQNTVPKLGTEWTPIIVRVDDLPLEGLSRLRIRFDLTGPGEVWIDDIQLSALDFLADEQIELQRLISPAYLKLEKGQVTDCIQLLEGYWPRLMMSKVPNPVIAQRRQPLPRPPKPPSSPGFFDRIKGFVPEFRFF